MKPIRAPNGRDPGLFPRREHGMDAGLAKLSGCSSRLMALLHMA
jgi:hypothetical protein